MWKGANVQMWKCEKCENGEITGLGRLGGKIGKI